MILSRLYANSAIPPPKMPISLSSGLLVNLRVCINRPFQRESWASFEQTIVRLSIELCNLSATSKWLYVHLCLW